MLGLSIYHNAGDVFHVLYHVIGCFFFLLTCLLPV